MLSQVETQSGLPKDIQLVRNFAQERGIVFDTMFSRVEAATLEWGVYYSWPFDITHPDAVGAGAFASKDEALAWQSDLEEKGYETFLSCLIIQGDETCQLTPEFLLTSPPYKVQAIFEEGVHVWFSKHFAPDDKGLRMLDEGIANYISFQMCLEWFREHCPQLMLLAHQFICYKTLLYQANEVLVQAYINEVGAAEFYAHASELIRLRKYLKSFRHLPVFGKRISTEKDLNTAFLMYQRHYSGLFFQVKAFFEENHLNIYDFLANPHPHKEQLLSLRPDPLTTSI